MYSSTTKEFPVSYVKHWKKTTWNRNRQKQTVTSQNACLVMLHWAYYTITGLALMQNRQTMGNTAILDHSVVYSHLMKL